MRRRDFLLAGAGWALLGRARASQALKIRGPLVSPDSPEYETLCQWFNPEVQWRPEAFAFPLDEEEVAACLSWAAQNGKSVAVRCGGHSYVGLSGGTGLVLDVSRLVDLQLDEQLNLGAGWKLGPLMSALAERQRMLPLGTCPGVGLSGYLLGGGYGLVSRALGLGCDRVLDATLVTPALGLVQATTQDSLLWALKGSGFGQFGVVTRWRLRPEALRPVVLFRRYWPWAQAQAVLERWLEWAPRADARITSYLSLVGGREPQVSVGGLFLGDGPEWKSLRWGPPGALQEWDRSCPYLDAMQFLAGRSQNRSPAFAATSDFLSRPLAPAAQGKLLKLLVTTAPCSPQVTFDAYGGNLGSGDGAFVHRASLACVQAICYRNRNQPPGVNHDWLKRYRAELAGHYSGRAYQNYCELGRSDWKTAYFGEDWPRLVALKERFDPQGILQHPLSFQRL
ncbi:MAG: FAD-binding oxidoreductase [Candidatus Eremiobacteraeota bacterium]|nr:FAD-binding oxidoreductase [Candidatus Eremiobacteraeota bacterium]MCW5872170.1 FAD-binding oxidoreductase [Candidatus Eremiobacteraeota bacterium]